MDTPCPQVPTSLAVRRALVDRVDRRGAAGSGRSSSGGRSSSSTACAMLRPSSSRDLLPAPAQEVRRHPRRRWRHRCFSSALRQRRRPRQKWRHRWGGGCSHDSRHVVRLLHVARQRFDEHRPEDGPPLRPVVTAKVRLVLTGERGRQAGQPAGIAAERGQRPRVDARHLQWVVSTLA
eukprot:scaffold213845_cov27-Tisochrysis_lutea.AAC.2